MQAAEYPLNAEGVWCEVLMLPPAGCPALFLDRDGVIIEDTEYLSRIEDIVMIPGAASVIAAANKHGLVVVMITNQAGIGRGYYDWTEFKAVQDAITAALAAEGARVHAVYACAHHPEGRAAFAHPDHPARKPNPGMLLQAASDLTLDLSASWLVGDKAIDVEAGKRAGIAGAMHVATGHGVAERPRISTLATPTFELRYARSIAEAMTLPIFAPRG